MSGMENPSKSEVIGRCGGDEKNEWSRRTEKSRKLKQTKILNRLTNPQSFFCIVNDVA